MRTKFIFYSILTFIKYSSCDENVFNIDCSYEIQQLSLHVKNVYTCKVTNNIVLTGRYVKKGSSAGSLDKGKSIEDVKAIYAYFKTINYLPDFTNIFGNLIGLSLDMCKLLKISKEELEPYKKLQHLNLHANKLRIIEKDLFIHNPNLNFIRLSHNMLAEIDPKVFDSLKSLEFLYFKGNECTQKDAVNPAQITEIIKILDETCVIKYKPAPISRPREEHKRVTKQKTSIWKTFGITFGTFAGLLVAVGIIYFFKKVFLQ